MVERARQQVAPSTLADKPTAAPLQGSRLRLARWAWMLGAALAAGFLVLSLPGYAIKFGGQLSLTTGMALPPGARYFAAASGIASLCSALVSLGLSFLIYRSNFGEPIAVFLAFFLLGYGIVLSGPIEFAGMYWDWLDSYLISIVQGVLFATPTIALLMILPNGKFVPGWTRRVVWLSIPWNIAVLLIAPFNAEGLSRRPILTAFVAVGFTALIAVGVYAQIYRYRHTSTQIERQQTRWAIFGLGLWLAYILFSIIPYIYLTGVPDDAHLPWWGPFIELGWWLSLNILPVCLTIAVTRYRLWNIDLVVNRALVYGALAFGILALYALIVGGMGLLFQPGDNLGLTLLATSLAAILFHPVQQRLQQAVNRLMFGDRDDPVAVLNKLGELLEQTGSAEATLSRIVETIAQTLKLSYSAIRLHGDPKPAAAFGVPVESPRHFPLVYRGEVVGTLLAAGREPGEELTPRDIELLEKIARHTGVVAHNVHLTEDLRRSRRRLVTAREEERRRIRRDLHDGLGPQLASQSLTLDAIEKLLDRDPEKVRSLIAGLKKRSQEAITDIRHLIYDLRPPALDDLGLIAALQQETVRHVNTGLRFEFQSSETFPRLPAAVELAAYRIAQEAINNAVKHASASICTVSLEVKDLHLLLCISDNGTGLPEERRSGVGLQTMQERALELGGTLAIEDGPMCGVRIEAVLPIQSP